jgi:hypothetical protein
VVIVSQLSVPHPTHNGAPRFTVRGFVVQCLHLVRFWLHLQVILPRVDFEIIFYYNVQWSIHRIRSRTLSGSGGVGRAEAFGRC